MRPRSRAISMLVLLAACLGTTSSPADQEAPLHSAEVRLADFGVASVAEIVAGEVTITAREDGDAFRVSRLHDGPPLALPLEVRTAEPEVGPGGCSLLDGAGLAGINALGGRYGAYALGGATASAEVGTDAEGRSVMAFRCDRSDPTSNCGLWMQLFDPTDPVRTYLDATRAATLSLWLRRRPAGAPFTFKVADAAWTRRDDSAPVGPLGDFGREGAAGGGWERVTIPLDALPRGLARDSLATLVLEAAVPGETELLLGGVEMCRTDGRPSPLGAAPSAAPVQEGSRGLWVWNTRELVDDAEARAEFLDWVEAGGYDRIFLQVVSAPGRSPARGFVPIDRRGMGALVADLRGRGALAYAMDGDPYYAAPENREGVLNTVRGVVEHNREAPPEQRFHGVHYDIEPYLIPGFAGPRREALLDGFVEVVGGISEIARSAGLEVGLAIPFWLDGADEYTGERFTAAFRGERAPILEHFVALVDEIAVMDYRTTAAGTNGAMALARTELAAARRAGIGVWIGVESAPLPDMDLVTFAGAPTRGPPPDGGGRWIVAESLGEGRARFWYVPDGGSARLRETLAETGTDPERVLSWRARPPVLVAGDAQSYERLGAERMRTEVGRMLRELADDPAFLGMAYHDYLSLRKLGAN